MRSQTSLAMLLAAVLLVASPVSSALAEEEKPLTAAERIAARNKRITEEMNKLASKLGLPEVRESTPATDLPDADGVHEADALTPTLPLSQRLPPPAQDVLVDMARRQAAEIAHGRGGRSYPATMERFRAELDATLQPFQMVEPGLRPSYYGPLRNLLERVRDALWGENFWDQDWPEIAAAYISDLEAIVVNIPSPPERGPGQQSWALTAEPEFAGPDLAPWLLHLLELAGRWSDEVVTGDERHDWADVLYGQEVQLSALLRSDGPAMAAEVRDRLDEMRRQIILALAADEAGFERAAAGRQTELEQLATELLQQALDAPQPPPHPDDLGGGAGSESRAAPRFGEVLITREGPRLGESLGTPGAPRSSGSLITRPAPRVPDGSGAGTCVSLPASAEVLRSALGCVDEALRGRAGVGAGCLSGAPGGLEALVRGEGCARPPVIDGSAGPALLSRPGVGGVSPALAAAVAPVVGSPLGAASFAAPPVAVPDVGALGVDLGGAVSVPAAPGGPRGPGGGAWGTSDEERAAEIALREATQDAERAERDEAQRLEREQVTADQRALVEATMAAHDAAVEAGRVEEIDSDQQSIVEEEQDQQDNSPALPDSAPDSPVDPPPVTAPAPAPYRAPESEHTEHVDVPEQPDVPEQSYPEPPLVESAPQPESVEAPPPAPQGPCEGLTGHNYGECLETSDGRLDTTPPISHDRETSVGL